ncbi:MAG TPA: P-II family nitrogen regulator [Solirubrobacteraceae bacterium]|nr:P-II family nitrogen regulator [Solirubrobacteraceae bacterium]
MKMVIAYVDAEAFEPIRVHLIELGIASLSMIQASGSVPDAIAKGSYRGITLETHVRPKTRIECVVGDDLVEQVVESVLELATDRRFVVVLDVVSAHPMTTVA